MPAIRGPAAGALADGAFKVVLAVVYLVGAAPLGRLLGTPAWLMVVSGLTLLTGPLMAWQGSGAGGEVWMEYQTAAPLVFAALLIAAAPVRMASEAAVEDIAR